MYTMLFLVWPIRDGKYKVIQDGEIIRITGIISTNFAQVDN